MTNPVYPCPHCRGKIEVELTEKGEIRFKKATLKETE